MPKNKRPVPRKPVDTPEEKDEAATQALAALALELVEREDDDTLSDALRQKDMDFHRLIKKALNQNKDDILYQAIELAKDEDVGAYQFLREAIEEAASTVLVRRDNGPSLEINAFLIPFFVHSGGGLKEEQGFQDQDAFEALVKSIQQAQLESAKAKVVLISHAYDLSEIDSITYSHLNDMVRDALASMTDKKLVAMPALERSIAGWSGSAFGEHDSALELRFLLGFALKGVDDPFYAVPRDDEAADAYFAARAARYQAWTETAGALLRRCLAPLDRALEINFLYQDLFHGAKQQGMAEYFMLQMMADINQALERHGVQADQVRALAAPGDVNGSMVLRVNIYGPGDAVLASSEKPLDLGADLELEVDDIADALATIGIGTLSVAVRFGADGQAVDARPYAAPASH